MKTQTFNNLIEKFVEELGYNAENDIYEEEAENNIRNDLKNFARELFENIELYEVTQHNQWFETSSECCFGYFTSFDDAKEAMIEGFDELYPGFKDDIYINGENQWCTDKFEFGVAINKLPKFNVFGEM